MRSIRARLLISLLLGSLVCTLAAALVLFQLADDEADEQSDARLRAVAWALPLDVGTGIGMLTEDDPDDIVQVQMWDVKGALVYRSERAPAVARQARRGFRSLNADGARWRVYTAVHPDRTVQVSQPIAVRKRIAAHMALRIAPPLLLLLPALGVMIWIVVGGALGPLDRVAEGVRGRSPNALEPLDDTGLPPELRQIVAALNGLLANIDSAMSAQRNFVADAAHELRSPLTALKLQLQLAERAADAGARTLAFGKLHERVDRAIHLVQQLLTLARHEHTLAAPQHASCDLLALARTTVADHAIYAESKAIDLGIDGAHASLLVAARAEGLAVMLSNLVDNALRYTQDGGRVDVSAGLREGRPYLRVADNGPGVPAPDCERLFDRFYRPDGNAVWGCGLGMSIVKSVADNHGAAIELASNADGRGLVVTVLLPAAALA
jgi:two-component system OmpR family sensor kinase